MSSTSTSITLVSGLLLSCTMGNNMNGMDGMNGMSSGGTMTMEFTPPKVIAVVPSPGPFDSQLAEDLDPSDSVVEVSLEAKPSEVELAPGRVVRMWAYNGVLPGPRIEARVGDTVRIRFKNSLPEPTTIHWHGLRVPAAMDGTAVAQSPVPPGGEFTYEFIVPDAGTFWYHPHVRSDEQVERGLYGAFVVRGDNEPTTTTDRTVVLDDLLVNPSTWELEPFDVMQEAMVGREGNLLLANGRARPIASVQPGGLHRFRFINSANARYFRLALPGHKLVQIGSDGGLLTIPRELDEMLLVPGQRADLVVAASGEPAESFDWVTRSYDRGHGMGTEPTANVFQMPNSDEAVASVPEVPASLASIAELPAPSLSRELRLEESMGSIEMTMAGMAPSFSINGETYPDVTPLVGELGSVEEWSIVNTTEMDHPFHLHGFRFQIVSEAGVATEPLAWRDTINIPAKTTVRIRVPLEDHPGTWVYHCHILEHAERGMMGELQVSTP